MANPIYCETAKPMHLSRKRLSLILRAFALIVPAHPYCARNSLRGVMPQHTLSARAFEEMWRCKALDRPHSLSIIYVL